jgi:hypothetical protein
VSLLQDADTNHDDADMMIRSGASGSIGYGVTPGQYITSALIQPNTWMRVAIVSDGYSSGTGRVFVNGQFIGTTGGDWVYNSTDKNSPKFGDGVVVPPASWSAWGQFPAPWPLSGGTSGSGMQSTFSIFSDESGDGESVYIKSFYFTDRCMSDAQVVALGGVNAAGIVFTGGGPAPCYANCDASTVVPVLNVQDFSCFLNKFAGGDSYANCDASTVAPVLNVQDFSCFLNRFAAGCC